MLIQIHSTSAIKNIDGVDCRVWEGRTEGGVEVYCLIARIAHKDNEDEEKVEDFKVDLKEAHRPPSDDAKRCFSLRQIM